MFFYPHCAAAAFAAALSGVRRTLVVRRINRQGTPEPRVVAREGAGEASVGARTGRPLSLGAPGEADGNLQMKVLPNEGRSGPVGIESLESGRRLTDLSVDRNAMGNGSKPRKQCRRGGRTVRGR
jgi:hypothetical protein